MDTIKNKKILLVGNNIVGKQEFSHVKYTAKLELEKCCLDWINKLQ